MNVPDVFVFNHAVLINSVEEIHDVHEREPLRNASAFPARIEFRTFGNVQQLAPDKHIAEQLLAVFRQQFWIVFRMIHFLQTLYRVANARPQDFPRIVAGVEQFDQFVTDFVRTPSQRRMQVFVSRKRRLGNQLQETLDGAELEFKILFGNHAFDLAAFRATREVHEAQFPVKADHCDIEVGIRAVSAPCAATDVRHKNRFYFQRMFCPRIRQVRQDHFLAPISLQPSALGSAGYF
ncbi:hypothetical protein D3C80_1232140 [compost metagenome]